METLHPVEVELHPSELLFVPSGSPHFVENLDVSLAISGNFVDDSNFDATIQHLKINSLVDPRARDLLQEFLNLDLEKMCSYSTS